MSTIGVIGINFIPQNNNINGQNLYLKVSISKSYPTDPNSTIISPLIPSSNLTGTYNFNFLYNTSGFNITMLMPPSNQPVTSFINVLSYISNGSLDQCFITIDGINPNNLNNLNVIGGPVQSFSNMTFSFTIQTPFFIN